MIDYEDVRLAALSAQEIENEIVHGLAQFIDMLRALIISENERHPEYVSSLPSAVVFN